MRFILLVALFGYINCVPVEHMRVVRDARVRDADQPMPPQRNPNEHRDTEGHEKSPEFAKDFSSDAQCNFPSIVAATGDNLAKLVRDAPRRCVNNIFNLAGADAKNACNEADMSTIANAFYGVTANYDGNKPEASVGILNFAVYLRGCYYVQNYHEADTGKYSNNLLALVKYGLDNFVKRPTLDAPNNRAHAEIGYETITLIVNAHESLNYVSQLAQVLGKLDGAKGHGNIINAIFDNFFRTHEDVDKATTFYKTHPEVATSLNDFMNKYASYLNTDNEWLLRNAGGELARFLKYQASYPQISGYIKAQLVKYTPTNAGFRVWAAIAKQISTYDEKNCAVFNMCNLKADLEKKILPYSKTCPTTYVDTFKVRAQQISDAEADTVCTRLKAQENYYHNLVKTQWKPVSPDTNKLIEVVIFNSVDDYKLWADLIFGISTDNGGMYIEGNPSKEGNIARYFCYERPQAGQFDVWNLEHEFTHYLDGRYDMWGDFGDSSKGRTIWWIEGFAEYAANKDKYSTVLNDCTQKKYPLSAIFNNNYQHDTERIYHYGYLAARYMFEKHRGDVDTIVGYFRVGKYADYDKFITSIGTKYDQDFNAWCGQLAGQGK